MITSWRRAVSPGAGIGERPVLPVFPDQHLDLLASLTTELLECDFADRPVPGTAPGHGSFRLGYHEQQDEQQQ